MFVQAEHTAADRVTAESRLSSIPLSELKAGLAAVIEALTLPESVQHHLMHMGFVPESTVVAVRRAPAGDPTVYSIDGMEIALRRETAEGIVVRPLKPAAPAAEAPADHSNAARSHAGDGRR